MVATDTLPALALNDRYGALLAEFYYYPVGKVHTTLFLHEEPARLWLMQQ